MKHLIYCIIIAMSISLAFSGGKPCCNKKKNKNTVSCKFNDSEIKIDQDIPIELTDEGSTGLSKVQKCKSSDGSKCTSNTKKPWWKFWKKKPNKNCPCKQTYVAIVSAEE